MPISTPTKITTPWATSGLKDPIPAAADPINGRAGYDQGFPAINLTPKTAGGIPPFGQDFNGILFDLTTAIRYQQSGGSFPYDSAWAAAVGGYPIGALVSRTDNQGFWRNTSPNNTADPEAGGAGWQPEGSGATALKVSESNVTLTPLQASRGIIIISGTLMASIQIIFPAYVRQWLVLNNTTGSFSITCKTDAGAGVTATQGVSTLVYGDGTNIGASAQTGFDYLNAPIVNVASTSNVNLTVAAPNTSNINITGTTTINGFTVQAGRLYFVSFSGALTLTDGASINTRLGANMQVQAGDTCIIRATAKNVVEVLCPSLLAGRAVGFLQQWQDLTASRAINTSYTNTTGRPIIVSVSLYSADTVIATLVVGGVAMARRSFTITNYTDATVQLSAVVPAGSSYALNTSGGSTSVRIFSELR